MIINCECGKKKFNIDSELIPAEGRLLKCGSCSKVWHYSPIVQNDSNEKKLETQTNEDTIKDEVNSDDKIEIKIEKIKENIDIKNNANDETLNDDDKIPLNKTSQENNKNLKKLFYYFVVSIITLIGIIFFIDTLKFQIANIFPGIIPLLDSFYQTVLDFKLFFKDLTN